MSRYMVALAYYGTPYVGWQKQPNGESVQAVVEKSLSTLLQSETAVVGCGRTDAGVHASHYILHFDGPTELPVHFLDRFNKLVGRHVRIQKIEQVANEFHARFAAKRRAYIYYLSGSKPIFHQTTRSFFPQFNQLDFGKMEEAAALISQYSAFAPFCKTNSDVHTMNCEIFESRWEKGEGDLLIYHISANRFLRGMVRLIVGMSLNVGIGKLTIGEVRDALERQQQLVKSWSAPAEGLFLSNVEY